jgi:Na+/pantothenate symporter
METKMKVRSLALIFSFVLLAGVILAHGDKKHVIGTVQKMSADAVTVKTTEGSVDVKLVAGTTYVVVGTDKVAKPAKVTDLHVGDRVVIHATPKPDNTLEAAEVRFSSVAATAASKPKP